MDSVSTEVDGKIGPVNVGILNFLYWLLFKGWTSLNKTVFVKKNMNTERGRVNVKIRVLLYWDKS
jgi:hypothetical protein